MRTDVKRIEETSETGGPLYQAAQKVFPQSVRGRFRTIKTSLLVALLGLYYLLPFVRWDRGPNLPHQAVLIDMAGRRAFFFFIEIWPQEVYYLTGILIIAAMTLFLTNALAGRAWCGYVCPQTVWTDLFIWVERLVEGDRRERMILDAGPWTLEKIVKRFTKHVLWLIVAWWTGGAFVLYFADAPTLVRQLFTGSAPAMIYAWMAILTFTTYSLAGFMRDQLCVYMCPWPRIQAALTDTYALNVTYRGDRGEPRMSLKQATHVRETGGHAGDCIDCHACMHVCPTGVDIRHGSQLGCIQCGLCIDACDAMMKKINRPTGLIGYDNDISVERRTAGLKPLYKPIRARTLIYAVVIAIAGLLMIFQLANRAMVGVEALHDRNPLAIRLSSGAVRNGYAVQLINRSGVEKTFALTVSSQSASPLQIMVAGASDNAADTQALVAVGPDRTREVRVFLSTTRPEDFTASTPIVFQIKEVGGTATATTHDFFKLPADGQ